MKVNKDKLVSVHYRLYRGEGETDLVEDTHDGEPMEYIHGLGLLLPVFEANLLGKEPGDTFDIFLKVDDAYGRVNPDLQMTLPKETFFVNGAFDEEMVYEGAILPMLTSDGHQVEGEVIDVWEEGVDIDFNHPLAGEDLHFVGEVVEVRDPSSEELKSYTELHHDLNHECGCGCGHDHDHSDCHHDEHCGHNHHHEGECGCGKH